MGRKASADELKKTRPILKDLDFNRLHPTGLLMVEDTFERSPLLWCRKYSFVWRRLADQLTNECSYLEGFAIMDYSMLLGCTASWHYRS